MADLFGIWLERGAYTFGEQLNGKVIFPDPTDEKLQKVVAVKGRVHARVHGSGTGEHVVVTEGVLHQGPVTVRELPFSVTLPTSGPISWDGRYVKVTWEVVAELDIPWAIDPKRTLAFQVSPRGER